MFDLRSVSRTNTRPRRFGLLGDAAGALLFAHSQTAQIKQALQANDVITALSLAAGNPWNTKPTQAQVEALINSPSQGPQVLQKLWDAVNSDANGNPVAGYRSPLPGTLPLAQLQSNLSGYLSLLSTQVAPAPGTAITKAVQQGTTNVYANSPVLQTLASLIATPAPGAPPPASPVFAPSPTITTTTLAPSPMPPATSSSSASPCGPNMTLDATGNCVTLAQLVAEQVAAQQPVAQVPQVTTSGGTGLSTSPPPGFTLDANGNLVPIGAAPAAAPLALPAVAFGPDGLGNFVLPVIGPIPMVAAYGIFGFLGYWFFVRKKGGDAS